MTSPDDEGGAEGPDAAHPDGGPCRDDAEPLAYRSPDPGRDAEPENRRCPDGDPGDERCADRAETPTHAEAWWTEAVLAVEDALLTEQGLDRVVPVGTRWPDPRLLRQDRRLPLHLVREVDVDALDADGPRGCSTCSAPRPRSGTPRRSTTRTSPRARRCAGPCGRPASPGSRTWTPSCGWRPRRWPGGWRRSLVGHERGVTGRRRWGRDVRAARAVSVHRRVQAADLGPRAAETVDEVRRVLGRPPVEGVLHEREPVEALRRCVGEAPELVQAELQGLGCACAARRSGRS